MRIIRILLLPVSFLYGLVVLFRNWLFDLGILRSQTVDTPTVVIGNLHAGGTGKTPHTIYLAEHFQTNKKLAILSRGYGRSSHGFRYVTANDSFRVTGDEALIFAQRTSGTVAVCENRVAGIHRLETEKSPDMILLDDAFQHRKLKAGVYVLLVPYGKPLHSSYYLPSGELRDHRTQVKRANAIVVTGTPKHIKDAQRTAFLKSEAYPADTPVFFSETHYGSFMGPLPQPTPTSIPPGSRVIVITGIAHPERFTDHLMESHEIVNHFRYKDHYAFTQKDIQTWKAVIASFPDAYVLTTEKDAMRLLAFAEELDDMNILYLPIEVKIQEGEKLIELIETSCSQPNNSKNLSNS